MSLLPGKGKTMTKKLMPILTCYFLLLWNNIKEYLRSEWNKLKEQENINLSIILFLLFMTTLFSLPNPHDLRIQRDSYLILSILLCGGMYVFMRNKFAGIFILYCAFIAISKGINFPEAMFLISFLAVYIGVSNYKGSRELIYDFLILIASLNLFAQTWEYFGLHFINSEGMAGFMANRNETSALYAITAAACLRKDRYQFLVINIIGLCLSMSLGGVIAFCGMVSVWTFIKFENINLRGIIISMLLAFFVFFGTVIHPFNIEQRKKERFFVWEQTAKVAMLQHTGWGWGQYKIVMPLITSWKHLEDDNRKILISMTRDKPALFKAIQEISSNDPDIMISERMQKAAFVQAHNEYVEFLFTAGWIGLLIGFVFLGSTLWTAFKSIDPVPFYGIIASCVSAVTFFTWHITTLAVITVLYLSFTNAAEKGIVNNEL